MTFMESVKTCFSKYFEFSGRAERPEFWWWVLFTFATSLVLGLLGGILSGVFSLAILIPSLAVGARRLHDTDRSGWWQLLLLIPLFGFIILVVLWLQESKQSTRF